jgi:alpha-mannosidase
VGRGRGGGNARLMAKPARPAKPPRPESASPRQVLHLVGNAHIDPVWLWQWPEGYQEIRATFRSALDRMKEYPEFIFTCDSVAYYEWVAEIDPEMFREIRERVAEGRWELVGGWWVEPDCNLPSGESFVRQALLGQRFLLEQFGRIATVGYNVDPFGQSGMLPQLLRRAGMDAYVFMRPGRNELSLPGQVFWWQSADGSRVLTYRIPHEYTAGREDLGYHLDKAISQLPDRWSEMMAFYGVGNHGGGPTRDNLDSIRRLDGAGSMPSLRHSTPRAFFDRILAITPEDDIPTWTDDLQHHAVGCYAAHSGIKRWMRRAENELAAAEAWSAVAAAEAGLPYPHGPFGLAWRQVLFNQFHDTFGGTAIEPAYRDARDQLGEASSIAARHQNAAIQAISRRISIPADPTTVPIAVFNANAWPVRATVELEFGGLKPTDGLVDDADRVVPLQPVQSYATVSAWRSRFAFEADVPALGYRVYRVKAGVPRPSSSPLRVSSHALENDHLRLELDPATGRIARLILRGGDGELPIIDGAAGGGSRAVVLQDTSDTWGHRLLAFRDVIGDMTSARVEVIEKGPVRGVLRVDSQLGDSRLTEDYILGAHRDEVEIRCVLDWREHARLLKLRFGTLVERPHATYQIPYGAIQRPPNGEEEPGQQWVDVSGEVPGGGVAGLAILNDAKYSFDVDGGSVAVTAVRSPIFAHHEPAVPQAGVRYQFQDQGVQRFTLRLVPHRGPWDVAGLTRRGLELNRRPTVLVESFHDGPLPGSASFLSVEPPSLVLGAVKHAEDGDDLVLRVVETEGRPADARVVLPGRARELAFPIGPFEIRTFRVPSDPGAGPPSETDLLERRLDAT